jgi:putative spermidine/putrescine transport system permease protein
VTFGADAPTRVRASPRARVRALGRWALDWSPVVPFLLVAGLLLMGAAVWLVVRSLEDPAGGYSLEAWRDLLGAELNRRAIWTSLELAAVVATLTVVVGTPLAWFVHHLSARARSLSIAVLNVGANFTGAALAFAFVATIGNQGFLRLVLDDLGVHLGLEVGSFWVFVLVYLYFIVPLYVLLTLPAMGSLQREWWEAAQVASAGRVRYWRSVGGPVLAPFLLSGWMLIFSWAIGQFSVAFALTGTSGRTQLMTLRIGAFLFSATSASNRFQRAAAMSVLLCLIAGVALVLYRLLARRSRRWLAVAR